MEKMFSSGGKICCKWEKLCPSFWWSHLWAFQQLEVKRGKKYPQSELHRQLLHIFPAIAAQQQISDYFPTCACFLFCLFTCPCFCLPAPVFVYLPLCFIISRLISRSPSTTPISLWWSTYLQWYSWSRSRTLLFSSYHCYYHCFFLTSVIAYIIVICFYLTTVIGPIFFRARSLSLMSIWILGEGIDDIITWKLIILW